MRLPRRPALPDIRNPDPREADVADLGSEEYVRRPWRDDRVAHLTRDHRELRHPQHDVAVGDPAVQVVEDAAEQCDDRRLDAVRADPVRDVRASLDRLSEVATELRWIFAVHV